MPKFWKRFFWIGVTIDIVLLLVNLFQYLGRIN